MMMMIIITLIIIIIIIIINCNWFVTRWQWLFSEQTFRNPNTPSGQNQTLFRVKLVTTK